MSEELINKIHRQMLLALDNQFDKSVGSFAYDILKPPASELAEMDRKFLEIDEKRNIYNLTGEDLDNFILQFTPIKRKEATYANEGFVTIKGRPEHPVDRNTIVASTSHQYLITKGGRLDKDGVGEFEIECTEIGKEGNADVGTINHFPVTVSGLETVTNTVPITGGYDEEDDVSYRDRYFTYINLPATSGNIYHYLLWANSISGVGAVRVYPLWNGDNTVKLVIIDSNGQPASDVLVKEVQDYIDPIGEKTGENTWTTWGCGYGEAPVGAFCTVTAAVAVNVSVEADVKLSPGTDKEALINEFRQKLIERFSSIALEQDYNTISLAKIGCIILNLDGVEDLDNTTLKLNGKSENLVLEDEEVAVFDEVIFNEI